MIDRTRQAKRVNDQARQGLERERARDDERLRAERAESDAAHADERAFAEATLGREHEARASAEAELEERRGRDDARDADLREALALVMRQLELVVGSVKDVVANAPRGARGGWLGTSVDEIRAAIARIQRLVQDAGDPHDAKQRYHDLGGEG